MGCRNGDNDTVNYVLTFVRMLYRLAVQKVTVIAMQYIELCGPNKRLG